MNTAKCDVTKYTVSLTVNCGEESNTVTKTQYITVKPIVVTADFSADPTTGEGPMVVQFTDEVHVAGLHHQ